MSAILPRRTVLSGGALLVGFALAGARTAHAKPPGGLEATPMLDSWIRVDPDGRVTVLTGKAELGQGIRTALIQLAAEELDIAPDRITLITADTGATPDEGYTAGSHSMQDSGTAIANAAAEVRALLVQAASARWDVPAEQLTTADGVVRAPDGRSLAYGALAGTAALHGNATPPFPLKPPGAYRLIGRPMPRVDIPAIVTGGANFAQDLRLPGMVHARVVRPPAYGGALEAVDPAVADRMTGVLKIVRDGSSLGVIATHEFQAIAAMRALAASARWGPGKALPDPARLSEVLRGLPARDVAVLDTGGDAAAGHWLEAAYSRPYLAHGAIGPPAPSRGSRMGG